MRVKGGFKTRRRRKKVLKRAEGYMLSNSRCFATAKEKNDRALVYAFRDRKQRKRHFRQLWNLRINAAARLNGTTYSRLIGALHKANVEIDRKSLAEMAVNDMNTFAALVKKVGTGAGKAATA
jgi:large subunit ribosomal protein L20